MALQFAWMLSGLLALLVALLGFTATRGAEKSGVVEVSVWQSAQLLWAIAIIALLLAFALYLEVSGHP